MRGDLSRLEEDVISDAVWERVYEEIVEEEIDSLVWDVKSRVGDVVTVEVAPDGHAKLEVQVDLGFKVSDGAHRVSSVDGEVL